MALCGPAGEISCGTLPTPAPGDGELVLRLSCCGLCGTDLYKIARGTHVDRVLGHELVGTVAALGSGTSGFSIGQRVVTPHHVACGRCRLCRSGATTACTTFREEQLAPGGFSEFVLVHRRAVAEAARVVPASLPDEAAVFLEPGACVLRGIDRSGIVALAEAGLEPSAVILGGGSMGLLHLLVLRCVVPAARIVVSEPVEARRRLAVDLGATAAVRPAELSSTVDDLTDGGADASFDTVGNPALIEPTLALLRAGGTLVLFAHFGDGPDSAVQESLFRQERRMIGTYSAGLDEQERVFDLLVSGRLRPEPLVTHTLPLSQIERAVDLAVRHLALKVLLVAG